MDSRRVWANNACFKASIFNLLWPVVGDGPRTMVASGRTGHYEHYGGSRIGVSCNWADVADHGQHQVAYSTITEYWASFQTVFQSGCLLHFMLPLMWYVAQTRKHRVHNLLRQTCVWMLKLLLKSKLPLSNDVNDLVLKWIDRFLMLYCVAGTTKQYCHCSFALPLQTLFAQHEGVMLMSTKPVR